jgi:exodeoxyribonuclease V alpha subunit
MEQEEGGVSSVVVRADDSDFSVVRLDTHDGGTMTAVGHLPEVSPGTTLILIGEWKTHAAYGPQFKVQQCEVSLPATVKGIEAYLGSSMIDGVGPQIAKAIVDKFGADTLDVLDQKPEKLEAVEGVGPKRAASIAESWNVQKDIRTMMMFLQGHGLSTNLALKIHKEYGEEAPAILQEDPYRLARDIHGVGFKTADDVAQKLGLPTDSPSRIQARLLYTLEEETGLGHTYACRDSLIEQASNVLGLPMQDIAPQLAALVESEDVVREPIPQDDCDWAPDSAHDAIYSLALHHCETSVAERITSIVAKPPVRFQDNTQTDWDVLLARAERDTGVRLSGEQRHAVETALANKITVLTGGPGTGKTVTVQSIIKLLEWRDMSYRLCAPTGRAAKRLSEATGQPAETVHRLLEYSPVDGWMRNRRDPLHAAVVIVDEASMMDIRLAYRLFDAVRDETRVIFVGDIDQLPSVGAGDVLRDIISSDQAAVVRLTEVFRQATGSGIVVNAHRINAGEYPILNTREFDDFFLFTKENPRRLLVDIVSRRIPERFGLAPNEIQVLAPMYRGVCGIDRLNELLQATLNPPSPIKAERKIGRRMFRTGDRVMQTRNDYDKDVFNGDIGEIVGILPEEKLMTVNFDGEDHTYEFDELQNLTLAYAISIHKSQGSEYPAVVVPVLTQHYIMLQRNLLYTAITRAEDLVVTLGTKRAIGIAVSNDEVRQRNSGLAYRLQIPLTQTAAMTDDRGRASVMMEL